MHVVQIEFKGVGRRLVPIQALGRQAVEFVDLELERCAVTQRKQQLLFDETMNLVGGDAEAKSSFFEQQKFTGHGAFGFPKPVPTISSKVEDRGQTLSGRPSSTP